MSGPWSRPSGFATQAAHSGRPLQFGVTVLGQLAQHFGVLVEHDGSLSVGGWLVGG
jgi:hypothetical protein